MEEKYDYEISTKNFVLKMKNKPETFEEIGKFIEMIHPRPKKRGRPPKNPFAVLVPKPKRPYRKTGKYSKKKLAPESTSKTE
ncbi:MAG: hypothetical protein QXT63_06710 [Thermoplasmata archaeon]